MPAACTAAPLPAAPASARAPAPRILLRTETLLSIDDTSERELPVIDLGWDGVPDRASELSARRLLEGFGAVEIGCLQHVALPVGRAADYLVDVDGDVHACCAFSAYALPQLEALGWRVDLAPGYPYRVVAADAPWFVAIDDRREGWFELELGVALGGQRISLLPALLDLLDRMPKEGRIGGLLRLAKRCVALPVGEGLYLPLPAERLARVLSVVRDLYEGNKREDGLAPDPRLDLARAACLPALHDALASAGDAVSWRGGDRLREVGAALRQGPAEPIAVRGLCAELRPYQRHGVAWLQHLASLGMGGVLADDMGLGKTLQTIAHILIEKQQGRLRRPALIVAPTSLVPGWCREIGRFAPDLSVLMLQGAQRQRHLCAEQGRAVREADVVVTSYPLLVRDLAELSRHEFHLLVLDEAQAVKNLGSRAAHAARDIPCALRIGLTGTPLENNLGELFAIFDLLLPGLLGSREQFQHAFAAPILLGDDDKLDQLRRRVGPFMLRRKKCEVETSLPPKTEIVRPIELPDDQRELYESIRVAAHAKVRKAIRDKGLAAATVPVLDALMKLRQVCCHPRLCAVPAAAEVRGAAKYEALLAMLRQQVHAGHKVLVFSQFARMLAVVSEGLLAEGIRHVCLTGATTDRQAKVDAFQGGSAPVFLISLKAGGTGLTLTAADTVIHYDPWWNPAAQAQATDRAYRIGQDKPVFVHKLIVAGSVEEKMLRLQQRKQELADAVLTGAARSSPLSEAEVDDLFAPIRSR